MKSKKITLKKVATWARKGYTTQVRDYTKSIESDPEAVLDFCDFVGSWFSDYDWADDPRFTPAADKITESIATLEVFLDSNLLGSLLTLVCTNHQLTVEISWIDPQGEMAVWDRFFVDCEDPVILLTLFSDLLVVQYKLAPPVARRVLSPMDRYHPERYYSTRKFARKFAKLFKEQVAFETGWITVDVLQRAISFIMLETLERYLNHPRRKIQNEYNQIRVVNFEIDLASIYGRFAQAGRQIMDFPPALCEMLSHTDIGNIPVGVIRLPYVCQYLYFGMQKQLELEPGWFVDGAYIESRGEPGEFKIVMTTKPPSVDVYDLWYLTSEPYYPQSFDRVHRETDLATALEEILRERLAVLFGVEERAETGADAVQQVKVQLADEGLAEIVLNVTDVSGKMALAEIDDINRRNPVFIEALKLIINGLLYITAYPEDIKTTWSDEAPFEVRQNALHGNTNEKKKANSKLEEMGYSAVHLCGQSFNLHNPNMPPQPSGDGHKSLHWRRGHWRNQRFGEGRTQQRLRWIMPMLVGGKNSPGDDPDLGHVYLIS